MKKSTLLKFSFVLVLSIVLFSIPTATIASNAESSPESAAKANREIVQKMYGLQIPFIENQGQVSDQVGFYAKTFGGTVFVTREGDIVYALPKALETAPESKIVTSTDIWALRESLVGANTIRLKSTDRSVTMANYFIGNDSKKWKTNLSTYNSISLERIYDGIDLSLKAYGNNVEKVFTVHPLGSVSDIRLKMEGTHSMRVKPDGELEIETGLGPVNFSAPIAFQEIDGERRWVEVSYDVSGRTYGFQVAAYDRNHPLVIDPLLASTFVGGSTTDYGYAIALDESGNVYLSGGSWSSSYPSTPGAYDETSNGSADAYVSRFDSDISTLLASSFIGGTGSEYARGIAIDSTGNIFVTGDTSSADYPTTAGVYNQTNSGTSVYISKLTPDLSSLSASTFVGGGIGNAIALDSSDNVYVTGSAYSSYPTTPGAYDTTNNGFDDLFVSQLDADLITLIASTFIGGSIDDVGNSIALDDLGYVYVIGSHGAGYPTTPGAYDTTSNGNGDAVVSKLPLDLSALTASTYIGGDDYDYGNAIVLDGSGNVFITGQTLSSDFPTTPGAYNDTHTSGYDVFVSILDADLATLSASTFIGGGSDDVAYDIALDSTGSVYVVGDGYSSDYPVTTGSYDETYGGSREIFISILSTDLAELTASTYLGGSEGDYGQAIVLDGSDNVYVTGYVFSADFPSTAGAYDESHGGNADVFISKLSGDLARDGIAITVTNTNDSGAGSLRQAIADAYSGDTIDFNLTYPATITLSSVLTISDISTLTINGPGEYNLTIDGNSNSRIFGIINSTVVISNLAMANGKAPDGPDGVSGEDGGAIFSDDGSNLILINCTLHENYAGNGGSSDTTNGGDGGDGGAIFSNGILTLNNCIFAVNYSGIGGNATQAGYIAGDGGDGGAIFSGGTLTMNNCYLEGNTTGSGGDAGLVSGIGGDGGDGGGIVLGSGFSLSMDSCVLNGNQTGFGGAGFDPGLQGGGGGISGYLYPAIVSITNSVFVGNFAGYGGAVLNFSNGGICNIVNCTFTGNTAVTEGGALFISSENQTTTISNSIFWGDAAALEPEILALTGTGGTVTVSYSNVQGTYTGTGNIEGDPLFTAAYNFRLQAGSPCIDAADSTMATATDLTGYARYDDPATDPNTGTGDNGDYYDIGAYEYLDDGALQRAVLIALYNATDGDNWTDSSGWKEPPLASDGFSEAGECDTVNPWFGVTCDTGNVTSVSIVSNNLIGTLPDELGSLSNLQTLYLGYNQLSGSIPSSLGNLSSLNYLNFYNNPLTGGVPPELGSLSNLAVLNLGNCDLTGSIPSELGNLSNLQTLYLELNALTGAIPTELENLTNLVQLRVDGNQLTGSIPPEFGNMTSLQQLWLGSNQLTGSIPVELASLANLQYLTLGYNLLDGTIPTEMGSFANLTQLDLSNNQLTGSIPIEIVNLSGLQGLYLGGNLLTGTIPPELGNLLSLTSLSLQNNQLSGSIPSEFGNLSNLEHLQLYGNLLTGSIPPVLGSLSDLTFLQLQDNQLSGTIPPELGNLSSLTQLALNMNQLSGTIPPELGNLTNLIYLHLYDNQLSGSIPQELSNLSNLQRLYLNGNQFSGSISTLFLNLSSLVNSQSDFTYNAIYTSHDNLRIFLNSKQFGGDWESTQTIAPGNVAAGSPTENSLTLTWDPIVFQTYTGGYEVYFATVSGGPYTLFETTTDKTAASSTVTGLSSLTVYYFRLRTLTNSHGMNQNDVYSEYTAEVTATTAAGGGVDTDEDGLTDSEEAGYGTDPDIPDTDGDGFYDGEEILVYDTDPLDIGIFPTLNSGDYYVDADAVSLGDGTSINPWRVLHHAIDVINDGTAGAYTLYVDEGVYTLSSNGGSEPDEALVLTQNNVTIIGSLGADLEGVTPGTVAWQNALEIQASNVSVTGLGILNFYSDYWYGILISSGDMISIDNCAIDNGNYALTIESGATNVSVTNCTITWHDRGGITVNDSSATVGYNVIYDNVYGIYISETSGNDINPVIINNLIYNTQAWTDYGIVLATSTTAISPLIAYNTIDGGRYGININGASSPGMTLQYNIISNFAEYGIRDEGATPSNAVVEYNNVYSSVGNDNYLNVTVGVGNVSADPLFEDAAGGDFHLQQGSPSMDAIPANVGDIIADDLEGNVRPLGSGYDMGAYEDELLTVSQRDVLIALYDSTDGDNWTDNIGWFGFVGDECDWYGITCDVSNNVIEINLNNNNLDGTIPATIGSLISLEHLQLYGNQLSGSLPSSLGNLSVLTTLWLDQNLLTGSIPASFGYLLNLLYLDLNDNQLTGSIPYELGSLSNLLNSNLGDNSLTGVIPQELGNLSSLQSFSLRNNQLTGSIPTSLGNLSNLVTLALNGNQLSGDIPTELGSLTSLQSLWLHDNQLIGAIPTFIGSLSNLRHLYLNGNELSDEIPVALGGLTGLLELGLNDNQLSGPIPTNIGDLVDLQWLGLNGNQLSGSIPTTLASLANLAVDSLDLRWNAIWTLDTGLLSFLDSRQIGGDWESTQTVAPADLTASSPANDSITLTWTAIPYTEESGGYGIGYTTTPGGPYTLFENTVDKTVTSSTVTGLMPGITYYFVIEAFTSSHANNQNDVYSEHTEEVSETIIAIYTLTVNISGQGSVDVSPPGGTYDTGTVVALTALPAENWYLSNWTGALSGNELSDTVTMDADNAVTAVFLQKTPPEQPQTEGPFNEATIPVGSAVTLDTSEYHDPDGDLHEETIWEVWRADTEELLEGYQYTDAGLTDHVIDALLLEEGLKYGWRLAYVDSDGNQRWSPEYFFKVGTPVPETLPEVPAGKNLGDFGMISIVHWPDDPDPQAVFDIEYNPNNYRIGRWDPVLGSYIEFGKGLEIEPGHAYWILTREPLKVNFNGIPVSTMHDLEVHLFTDPDTGEGWNMIAPPNENDFHWKYLMVGRWFEPGHPDNVAPVYIFDEAAADLIDQRIWEWNDGAYVSYRPEDNFQLRKYKGYWVKAQVDNTYLVYSIDAQVANLSTHAKVWLAVKGKSLEWIRNVMPQTREAIADNDMPPMPMGLFEDSVDSVFEGCFIETMGR